MTLRPDGTAECPDCGLPMFPFAATERTVTLECANHHHVSAPPPDDRALRGLIENWVAKRGAQLHAQHERWERDEEE